MKTMILFSISLIALCCITTLVYAQPGLPSAPSQAPIDGGLGLLAAAGAVYAWKKLRGKKDEK